jgi:hypothetical protein
VKFRALTAVLCAFAAFVATYAPAARADEADFAVSKKYGRRFRVQFDPESRIRLGLAASGVRDPSGRVDTTLEVQTGVAVRRRYGYGEGPSRVEWQFDQRLVTGWIAPFSRPFGDMPSFEVALYGAFAHRHDLAPRIVLPSSPPASIPFPFDIGVEGEFVRVVVPRVLPGGAADGRAVPFLRVGVARGTAFVDPWRSNSPGRSIEIGLGVRYDIDMYGPQTGTGPADSIARPRLVHRVAPMTAGSVRFRFETQDGLFSLDVRGEVVPHWTSEGIWKVGALGYGRAERTLIAIDDQPIAAFFESSYRLVPPALELARLHDLRISLGFSFGIDLTPDKRVKEVKSPSRPRPSTLARHAAQ